MINEVEVEVERESTLEI